MRVDQFSTSVVVDDRPLGVFDAHEGGVVSAEEQKYRPGGMKPQKSLGGYPSTDNVTVRKLYEPNDVDIVRWLRGLVGKATAVITKQPLDVDGNPFGKPDVFTGKLQRVAAPDHDSNDSGPALFEIEVSTEGTVG